MAKKRRHPDYYAILGVSPTASHDEIKKAKKQWGKVFASDRLAQLDEDGKKRAERKHAEINDACDTIGDPEKRRLYDQEIEAEKDELRQQEEQERVDAEKKSLYLRIRELFERGDIEGAVREAKNLYERFPDHADCQNNYAVYLFEWATHLAEKGRLKDAEAKLRQAAEHTLDDKLKTRIREDIDLLRAKSASASAPPPPYTPPPTPATPVHTAQKEVSLKAIFWICVVCVLGLIIIVESSSRRGIKSDLKFDHSNNIDAGKVLSETTWQQGLALGEAARQEGRLDDAFDLAEQALKARPDDAKGLALRASVETLMQTAPLYYGRRFEVIRWMPGGERVEQLVLNDSGTVLASRGEKGTNLWDPRTGQLLPATKKMPRGPIVTVEAKRQNGMPAMPTIPMMPRSMSGPIVGIDAKGHVAAVFELRNENYGIVRVVRLPDGEPITSVTADAAALSPDGKRLLCLLPYGDQSINTGPLVMYNLSEGKERWRSEPKRFKGPLAFALDGKTVAAGAEILASNSNQGPVTVDLLDSETGRTLRQLRGIAFRNITDIDFSPDGKQVLVRKSQSWMDPGLLDVFDSASGDKLTSGKGYAAVTATTADRKVGVAIIDGHRVQVFAMKDEHQLGVIDFGDLSPNCCVLTPDGRNLIVGMTDGQIAVLGVRGATTLLQPADRVTPLQAGDLVSIVCPASIMSPFRHGTKADYFYDGEKPIGMFLSGQQPKEQFTRNIGIVHAGIKLDGVAGAEVYPIADGTVVDVFSDTKDAAFGIIGYSVTVRHDVANSPDPVYSFYRPLGGPSAVKLNQKVTAGKTVLGVLAHKGNKYGMLNVEVRRSKDRLWPKWGNVFGIEHPSDAANFDGKEFADNWLDPERFVGLPDANNLTSSAIPAAPVVPPRNIESESVTKPDASLTPSAPAVDANVTAKEANQDLLREGNLPSPTVTPSPQQQGTVVKTPSSREHKPLPEQSPTIASVPPAPSPQQQVTPLPLPTPTKSTLQAAIDAHGGTEKLAAATSITFTSRVTEINGPIHTVQSTYDLAGGSLREVWTRTVLGFKHETTFIVSPAAAWILEDGKVSPMDATRIANFKGKLQMMRAELFGLSADKYIPIDGQRDSAGNPASALKVKIDDNTDLILLLDPKTSLIYEKQMIQKQSNRIIGATVRLYAFREFDGVKIATSQHVWRDGKEYTATVIEEVKLGGKVDQGLFQKPSANTTESQTPVNQNHTGKTLRLLR